MHVFVVNLVYVEIVKLLLFLLFVFITYCFGHFIDTNDSQQ